VLQKPTSTHIQYDYFLGKDGILTAGSACNLPHRRVRFFPPVEIK